VTSVDERISGSEAAALYGRLLQERREHEHHEQLQRQLVIESLQARGEISISELQDETGLGLAELLGMLSDLLADGRVLGHGTMLKLRESPGSTP